MEKEKDTNRAFSFPSHTHFIRSFLVCERSSQRQLLPLPSSLPHSLFLTDTTFRAHICLQLSTVAATANDDNNTWRRRNLSSAQNSSSCSRKTANNNNNNHSGSSEGVTHPLLRRFGSWSAASTLSACDVRPRLRQRRHTRTRRVGECVRVCVCTGWAASSLVPHKPYLKHSRRSSSSSVGV